MVHYTVKDLLSLDVLGDLEVLAGEDSLNKVVTNVTVFDAPDAIEWIRGGEFVITTLYPFRETSDQLRLISDLAAKNASALGIKLKRFVNSLAPEVIDLANKHSLPLLKIPYNKAWVDLINPIMAEILNRQLVMLQKSNSIRRSFIQEVLEGGKLKSIAKRLSELTHNPVSILELVNRQVETWPYYFQNHIREEDLLLLQNHTGNEVVKISSQINSKIEADVFPINIAGRVEGHILVWKTKELKEMDLVAVEHAVTVAGLHIQQLKTVNEINQRFEDDFVSRLLQGEFSDCYVQQKAAEMDWRIGAKTSIAVIKTIQTTPEDWRKGHKILFYIKNAIKSDCGFEIPMGMAGSDTIICLLPCDHNEVSPNIVQAIVRAKRRIVAGDKGIMIPIGIGKPRDTGDNLMQSYEEASDACRVSLLLNRDCCCYAELGPYALLVKMMHTQEAEEYVAQYILPLVQYDLENRTVLLKTLETFLEAGGNYRETAKTMYVHHNTIRYRLEMIEKILGVRFDKPETTMNMLLAIKLHHLKRNSEYFV